MPGIMMPSLPFADAILLAVGFSGEDVGAIKF
jgi:hypothetical protein